MPQVHAAFAASGGPGQRPILGVNLGYSVTVWGSGIRKTCS